VDDAERAIEIDRLFAKLADATKRQAALVSEAKEFGAMTGQIREAFGNPYFYSGANDEPEKANQSIANYSGFSSHDVVLPTVLGMIRVNRELRAIKDQLSALGVNPA
jgi:hypothetical protein